MRVYNYMEHVVMNTIDKLLKDKPNVCSCERCRMDIAAIALNNIKPKYVVSKKGELFTKLKQMDVQFEVDVVKEVTRAIDKVSREPHHDKL